ncbi:hypothetical protein [Dyadobacter sp. LHD-138]|uniref:hypothetical protein n=1 Tax=Dyadobacter sp. LHD-138 TaxID=3071413 RepID=UPI0027E107C1|nr:hypothetical protein [Dyadobacter sp. LHD-138]MDQ6479820.1 hypothetical protein [Dyadobacter sp. LHD-138]
MKIVTVRFYNQESNDGLFSIQLAYFPVFVKGQIVRFSRQDGSKTWGSVISVEQSFEEWECGSMEGTSHFLNITLIVSRTTK